MGKDIKRYGLPKLVEACDGSGDLPREVQDELSVGVEREHLDLYTFLNIEQRAGFEEILDHVVNNRKQVFFVVGPGGTGKTYLYKALLAKVRSLEKIAIATATSGIAASIMSVDVPPTPGSEFRSSSWIITFSASPSRVVLQSCFREHL